MIDSVLQLTGLSAGSFIVVGGAVFLAGCVRGFAGFGLSAILMASVVTMIPPVSLIPVCFTLEVVASISMFRGGMKDADMRIVWGLVIGSTVGVPLGLLATVNLDAELSKLIALCIILCLTTAQLFNVRPRFLSTKPGLYTSGLVAGVATGLASVGGMVVALYVLASDTEVRKMRASLIMFLAIGMFTSSFYLILYDILTQQAFLTGLVFAPIVIFGIYVGTVLFRPTLIHLYKRVCLLFLMTLCVIGLGMQLN